MEMYAGFGKSVYTAFATIGGNAVGVVATGEQLCHNCVAKASRFVRLCDAFSVPVLTIVNTNGFVPSTTDDIAGGIREAARLAATYADATTAKVCAAGWQGCGPCLHRSGQCRPEDRCQRLRRSALWSPTPLSPCCTRTRSTLPTTSSPLPTPRLLPMPLRCAAPPMLWPAALPI